MGGSKIMQPVDVQPMRGTYTPKIIRSHIELPEDHRTDQEKACDVFLFFVSQMRMWGDVVDAVGMMGSIPENHDGECTMCRTRSGCSSLLSLFGVPTDEQMRRASEILKKLNQKKDD